MIFLLIFEIKKKEIIPIARFASFYFLFSDSWNNIVHTISKLQTTQGQYNGDKGYLE